MKIKRRNAAAKRAKKVGFRTRSKSRGGKKVITRRIRKSGRFA